MPVTPCRGVLTSRRSYCTAHEPSRVSAARGSGPARARFRADTLAKTNGCCARCDSTDRVEAHHVIGLHEGGSNDAETNGLPLCHGCHVTTEANRTTPAPAASKPGAREPLIF